MPGSFRAVRSALLGCLLLTSAASAQEKNRLAFGGQFTIRHVSATIAHGSEDLGLLWRVGHSRTGWGWDWGLGWYAADVDRPGSASIDLGELHVRPITAGYGYTHVRGRTSISTRLLGGYSFNSIALTGASAAAYRERWHVQSVSASASNRFVIRPEVSVWYDLSRKIGVNANLGYVVARPTVRVFGGGNEEIQRVRADSLVLKLGAVYSVF